MALSIKPAWMNYKQSFDGKNLAFYFLSMLLSIQYAFDSVVQQIKGQIVWTSIPKNINLVC